MSKAPLRQCQHVFRSGPLHPSIAIGGGASLGQCESESFPELVFCEEHADKAALALLARRSLEKFTFQKARAEHDSGRVQAVRMEIDALKKELEAMTAVADRQRERAKHAERSRDAAQREIDRIANNERLEADGLHSFDLENYELKKTMMAEAAALVRMVGPDDQPWDTVPREAVVEAAMRLKRAVDMAGKEDK